MTGAASDLGRLVIPRLVADEKIREIVAFDVTRPADLPPSVRFERLDLLRPGIEEHLERMLAEHRLDAFLHLAFVNPGCIGPRSRTSSR